MPPCQGGASTGTYAGGESWRGVCPGVRHGDAWHRCRNRAQMGSIVMPRARRTRAAHRERNDRVERCAQNQPGPHSEQTRATITGDWISHVPKSRRDEACAGSGETTSVIDTINRRACQGKLSGTYPYSSKQSNPALLRVIRLQLRCNPDPRRNVRTRFFHRICMPAGPMERAPV